MNRRSGGALLASWHDPWLFFLTLAATLLGVLAIADAGYVRSLDRGSALLPREAVMQLIGFGVGWIAYAFVSRVPGTTWQRAATLLWILCCALLLLPKTPLGVEMNEARRWFRVGPVQLQPSEFAKVGALLYLSAALSARKAWHNRRIPMTPLPRWLDLVLVPKLGRALPFLWVLAAAGLIELEPDLGTAAVIVASSYLLLVAGGVSRKSLGLLLVAGILLAGVLATGKSYRMERLASHWHRWEQANMDDIGYQTVQSEIGMAMGGVVSLDAGGGRTKRMIPAPTTDFIMATIAEETGFVGAVSVIGLLGAIVARLLGLARRAPSRFGSLLPVGVASWIGIQSVVNVCMANALIMPIGVPLPFFSSGASSLVALWIAMGLGQAVLRPTPQRAAVEVSDASGRDRWRHGRARLSRA
ncbi:MAG: FtsW/RodA/SpoVE family cell cycle protein [Fimbriimonadales bacterium]|nr:FtsW/RodA/SpoVE family cell cycle protein [Fimbriimonadales bacterium]